MNMQNLGLRSLALLSIMLAVFGASSGNAVAEVRRSFINQSFEEPDLGPNSCFVIIDQDYVPGWNTNHAPYWAPINSCQGNHPNGNAEVELWANGANGPSALHENQIAELNAYELSRLSQNVCMNSGDIVTWSFGHHSRSGKETMEMTIGGDPFIKTDPTIQSIVEIFSNTDGSGEVVSVSKGTAERKAESNNWNRFSGEFEYDGNNGVRSIGFGALDEGASGNLLDDIHITLRPYVEIAEKSFVTREGKNNSGMPAIRVVGEVPQDLKVRLKVTGGTGTLDSDYIIPKKAKPSDARVGDIFVITVPAGDYGKSKLIPIGFKSISDEEDDVDEIDTVTFEMLPPKQKTYEMQSTRSCGDDPVTHASWRIEDDIRSISLVKSGKLIDSNDDGFPSAGDEIDYKFSISNDGNITLHDIRLTDTLKDVKINGGPIASLAGGKTDNTTYSATYTVTQNDIDEGKIVNKAVVNATSEGDLSVKSKFSSVKISLTPKPAISLKKTAEHDDQERGYAKPGDVITYAFFIENEGNVDLTDVKVSDPTISGEITGNPIERLAPGEKVTLTATSKITQAHINAGKRKNKATVTGTPAKGKAVSASDSVSTELRQAASLELTKSAGTPSAGKVGGTIRYTFDVVNTGNVTLSDITIHDTKVAEVNCASSSLAPGAEVTCTAMHVITQAEVNEGKVENKATAKGKAPNGKIITSNESRTSTSLPHTAAFNLSKKAGKAKVSEAGEKIDYKIVVKNTGTMDLTGIDLKDRGPNGISLPLSGPTGDKKPKDTLNVGETWEFSTAYMVTQDDLDEGEDLVNTIAAKTDQTPAPRNRAITIVVQNPALSITADVDTAHIEEPGALEYRIVVTNSGNMTLDAPVLKNSSPGDGEYLHPVYESGDDGDGIFQVGEEWIYKATYQVTDDDIATKEAIVNKVTATGTATNGVKASDQSDSAETDIKQIHKFTLKKRVRQSSIIAPELLEYEIKVANSGNQPLRLTEIVDTLPDGTEIELSENKPDESNQDYNGLLDVDETWVYRLTFQTEQSHIDEGKDLKNKVMVTAEDSSDASAEVLSKTDYAITEITQKQKIIVKKSVDQPKISKAGDLIYTISVRNGGNTNQIDISITDTLPDGSDSTLVKPISGDENNDGVLDVGEDWIYEVHYSVHQDAIDKGDDLVSTVSVITDAHPEPQKAGATTTIEQMPLHSVNKTADPHRISGKGDINYRITLTNTGYVTLTGIEITDILDGKKFKPEGGFDAPARLEVGEAWTFDYAHTVDLARINEGGTINNNVTVKTRETNDKEAAHFVNTRIAVEPALSVEKKGKVNDGGDGFRDVGDTVEYTITVENNGNVRIDGIKPDDSGIIINNMEPKKLIFYPETVDLESGQKKTFTAIYTLSQVDVDAAPGKRVHVYTSSKAIGNFNKRVINSPTVSVDMTLPLSRKPEIRVDKTGRLIEDENGLSDVGDIIEYTINVENTGNILLTDVFPRDIGPTFNGKPARGKLSAFSPTPVDLAPLDKQKFVATYTLTQEDIDNAAGKGKSVVNTAQVTGHYLTGAGPNKRDTVEASSNEWAMDLPAHAVPGLILKKTGQFVDVDDNGFTNLGDRVDYIVSAKNTGNVPLTDVKPSDPGPMFDGIPGKGQLTAFSPLSVDHLPAGDSIDFTASYLLELKDINRAAGLRGAVKNTASVAGDYRGQKVQAQASTDEPYLLDQETVDVSIVKNSLIRQLRRGETAPFRITVTNASTGHAGRVIIRDTMPAGFAFLPGSAKVNNTSANPQVSGRNLIFPGLELGPNASLDVDLTLRALSTARPGTHINRANVEHDGKALAPEAEAAITILAEAVFDCSEVIGKVFTDLNRNGDQDKGEVGVPDVRLATVRGVLITTDRFGRYSVPCADLPDPETGSNYVLKLDTRSLPAGFNLTTGNPASIRLTTGKMGEVNFGVAAFRRVRLELDSTGFLAGRAEPVSELSGALTALIQTLAQEHSTLIMTYAGVWDALAESRVQSVKKQLEEAWRALGEPYLLSIEIIFHKGVQK